MGWFPLLVLIVFGMVSIAFMMQMPKEKPVHNIKRVIRGTGVEPVVEPVEVVDVVDVKHPSVEPVGVVGSVVEPGTMTDASNVVFKVSDKLDIENTVQTQQRLLYMLTHFTRIAEKNDINYWLCAGTLIGAIRHHGFIPWDADIDISIPYDSYIKLQHVAEQELPSDLWLQDWQSDPLYEPGDKLAKIRDLNSDYTEWSKDH